MHFYALEGGIKINHKNIILTLAILFVILLAASTVSATDNVTDDINNIFFLQLGHLIYCDNLLISYSFLKPNLFAPH